MSAALISTERATRIAELAKQGIDLKTGRLTPASHPLWAALKDVGSELWLDTGDIEAATPLYTSEFTALTTNNTLLNKEVQKGTYDELVRTLAKELKDLDEQTRVIEIAFILNARHGLRLAQTFGGKVSVELHTDLANDIERSLHYGRRYFAICPEHFIVKIPLTPAGLISARTLRLEGIPINFTLGFSARHNHLAAAFTQPAYCNVFLGRVNAYVSDNKLGDGKLVGEKAMLASQRAVTRVSGGRTKHIAASLRGASQVADLAGIDVYTMPTTVAAASLKELKPPFTNQVQQDYQVTWAPGVDPATIRAETLWDISQADVSLAGDLCATPPTSADELVARAQTAGVGDLFPQMSNAEWATIAKDGKIPKHATWAARIAAGELAIDTMLNYAALQSFTADQKEMDDRIRKYL
ncbi:MAG: transaldolase [Planctomycetes bacterium]|nr:transaldolase [Planctomycetota bacterium]